MTSENKTYTDFKEFFSEQYYDAIVNGCNVNNIDKKVHEYI